MSSSGPSGPPGKFQWLSCVSASFDAMIAAIDQARQCVRLEMYIYTDSAIGRRFREALTRAAKRGIQVRVLIDSLGSLTLTDSFWEPLIQAGGEFRWFNPLQLHRLAIRDHRKLLVCDDQAAFLGGFNIAEEYDGDGVTKGWFDLGLRVTGQLVAELACSFDEMFALADFRHRRFVRLRRARLSRIVSTEDGQLFFSAPGRSQSNLNEVLSRDLARARSVKIISAYFLPTGRIRRALTHTARRGGSVQLLLTGKSDVAISQLASRRFYQGFLNAGVNIHEYQPQILHGKLFLIDDVAYVGSANLDRRSLFINYELSLRLADPALTAEACAIFDAALKYSVPIERLQWRRARGFWAKLKERWAFWILARVDPYVANRQMKRLLALR